MSDLFSPPPIPASAPARLLAQPAFYEAYGVKPGDKMYVAPDKRVIIW